MLILALIREFSYGYVCHLMQRPITGQSVSSPELEICIALMQKAWGTLWKKRRAWREPEGKAIILRKQNQNKSMAMALTKPGHL